MSFRLGVAKADVLGFLVDGVARFRYEIVENTKRSDSVISGCLASLWKEGKVLRSRERLNVSFLDSAPGKGKFWRKMTACMWILKDSPQVLSSGIVEINMKKTERYTLETSLQKMNVAFIPYKPEEVNRRVSQEGVLELLRKRSVGAVAKEIADHFDVKVSRVSNILEKLRRKGLIEKRGHYNAKLGKETPFKGSIQGYVYELPGTDQAQKRIEQGEGLYSPHVKAVYVEIIKDSKQKRFTTYTKFHDTIGEHETLKAIRILTQIYPNLVTVNIGGLGFVFDKTYFTSEEIDEETEVCQERVSRQKRLTGTIGLFHEAFAQHAVDLALKKLSIKVTFWRRVTKGKEHYNIKLSNGREVDRVLQIDFYHAKQLLWRHYYPIECKFYRGGARPEHVLEFVDKLRGSKEFGEEIDLQEGNQTLRVHLVKQNVHPIMISPYFRRETYQVGKKFHVELVPTWLLGQLAGETVGRKLDVKTLFDDYLKKGGEIETFITEIFSARKKQG